VRRLARGRRRRRFSTWSARALLWGWVAVAPLAWLAPPAVALLAAGAVLALALLAAGIAAVVVPVDPVAVAKRYDDRVGTKDLVSSSLELPAAGAFAEVVREEAAAATGRAGARDLYPAALAPEHRWLPLPAAAIAAGLLFPLLTKPPEPPPDPRLPEVLASAADRLHELARQRESELTDPDLRDRMQQLNDLAERFANEQLTKKESLAELARLASQLDRKRDELEQRKLEIEQTAAKLARGEEMQDVRRDMDAGKYREAAQKVRKKIEAAQKKLDEARQRQAGKLELDALQKKLKELRDLLAELEQLDALGRDLGFLVETLEALERIEGELGELGEFDGLEFDDAEVGRPGMRRRPQPDDMPPDKLLLYPSEDAGKGHRKQVLGNARRSLTEREEKEARLREGKGKSSFGQVRTANDGSRSAAEYRETFVAAKRAAEDAIYRQNIPAGYRSYIRRYFDTMQPDEARDR
jgi:hypothetical protein